MNNSHLFVCIHFHNGRFCCYSIWNARVCVTLVRIWNTHTHTHSLWVQRIQNNIQRISQSSSSSSSSHRRRRVCIRTFFIIPSFSVVCARWKINIKTKTRKLKQKKNKIFRKIEFTADGHGAESEWKNWNQETKQRWMGIFVVIRTKCVRVCVKSHRCCEKLLNFFCEFEQKSVKCVWSILPKIKITYEKIHATKAIVQYRSNIRTDPHRNNVVIA